jgi:hypothetical protein
LTKRIHLKTILYDCISEFLDDHVRNLGTRPLGNLGTHRLGRGCTHRGAWALTVVNKIAAGACFYFSSSAELSVAKSVEAKQETREHYG